MVSGSSNMDSASCLTELCSRQLASILSSHHKPCARDKFMGRHSASKHLCLPRTPAFPWLTTPPPYNIYNQNTGAKDTKGIEIT